MSIIQIDGFKYFIYLLVCLFEIYLIMSIPGVETFAQQPSLSQIPKQRKTNRLYL